MAKMGIKLPPAGSTYRRLGRDPRGTTWRQISCGICDKSGRSIDFLDFKCSTLCLVWLLRGSGTYEDAEGRTVNLAAGDCFQRWPGRKHTTRIVADSGWYEAHINLGDELPQVLDQLGVLDARRTVWHLGLDPARLARWMSFRNALGKASDLELPALCIQAQALVVEAHGADLETNATQVEDPVDAACRQLAEQFAGRDDLREFCLRLGLDYETFRKRFRRETGVSPGQYRIRRRMERACALLQASPRSVADIALDLGYASPFDFSTQFRRQLGISPSHYRQRQG